MATRPQNKPVCEWTPEDHKAAEGIVSAFETDLDRRVAAFLTKREEPELPGRRYVHVALWPKDERFDPRKEFKLEQAAQYSGGLELRMLSVWRCFDGIASADSALLYAGPFCEEDEPGWLPNQRVVAIPPLWDSMPPREGVLMSREGYEQVMRAVRGGPFYKGGGPIHGIEAAGGVRSCRVITNLTVVKAYVDTIVDALK